MHYLIQKGDNLYAIAKKHGVNINDIINHNPYLNPYHLIIGSYLYIPGNDLRKEDHNLKEKMREIWEQHVYWTRLLIISITEHLKDEPETTARLLQNPNDIGALYRNHYGPKVADKVASLIKEHLIIGSKLIHALVDNNSEEATQQSTKWYKNADEIAIALSNISPHYNQNELKMMLYKHLELTTEEVAHRLNQNYKKEIEVFDNVEKQALQMADYLTAGIIDN